MPKRPSLDIKQRVQQQFADVASNYRKSKVHAAGIDLDRMVQLSSLGETSRVLDAGCGAGHTALAFAAHADLVIACDFTPPMLKQVELLATERGLSNVRPQLADVERLPFANDSFDLVVTRYSAHHWGQPERALAEFRRLLKADGALLISDIMAREDYAQDTFLQAIELLRDPSHVRDYRISEWLTMLANAGFAPEVRLTFDLTLRFDAWTRRMGTPRQHADMIKTIFNEAPADIRRAFRLPARIANDDFDFIIPGAVIRATSAKP
ncbi:MAG: class I SAM-dependent methyltransferase [Chloroflexota bacterium]|nr:class I SAM-dependent methyltransferase [Chloroflexota bacterium]